MYFAVGMTDALSDHIVERTRCNTPFLLKYIPYGALSEVRGCYTGDFTESYYCSDRSCPT